jgi:lysozyme
MKTSERGVAFMAVHEGVVTRAYRDVAGVWTIGVGHTAAAGPPKPVPGMTITRAEASAILARDLPQYERRSAAAMGDVAQHVFDGAVSFDFNTGAIDRASWAAAFRRGEKAAARERLMLWVRAGGRTVAGLVNRRKAEARLIFDGDYGDGLRIANGDEVRAWQADLATLGFYRGPIDGIAGPQSRAAVIAYQRSHPDLVADGIVGPATRASLARDMAARQGLTEAAGSVVAGAATAGGAAIAAGQSRPVLWAVAAGILLIAALGGLLLWRYRGELQRRFFAKGNGR